MGNVPNLSHLRIYGCKAYLYIKGQPKKDKLHERAHIGHLVGYEARTIFRIWISSQRKIIRTRDVTFNERAIYDAHEIDLMEMITEPMLETTFDSVNLIYIQVMEIEVDEDESQAIIIEENSSIPPEENSSDAEKITQSNSENGEYLPTPAITTSETSSTRSSSATLSVASVSELTPPPVAAPIGPPMPRMIGLDLDEANILPKRVGRRRAPRRQAYATALLGAQNGGFSSYYSAFSALSAASAFNRSIKPSTFSKSEILIQNSKFILESRQVSRDRKDLSVDSGWI